MTVSGSFAECPGDPHVGLRADLLEGRTPPPLVVRTLRSARRDPVQLASQMLADISCEGVAVAQLDGPLAEDAFLHFGTCLGRPMAEQDPAVQPYVTRKVILNLVAEHDEFANVSLAPFSTNYLSLHSEGSGRPVCEQPRYIALMCHEPGHATLAQTVLAPMALVNTRLSHLQRHILSQTRYQADAGVPMILRKVGVRPVFSFRDFIGQTLDWTSAADAPQEAVNASLRGLLAAIYRPGTLKGIRWRRGLLVIIDNTVFFHGRTAGSPDMAGAPRHLQRLRILDDQTTVHENDVGFSAVLCQQRARDPERR